MQMLVQQIESTLQVEKACFVRPWELERVWPAIPDEERQNIVRDFAGKHGWRIFSYNRNLGAMFVQDRGRSNQADRGELKC
jgi:hypothetical protein